MRAVGFSPSPPGSFPLSADPLFQDEAVRELQSLTDRVRKADRNGSFVGLILTGSFARGEGTIVHDARMRSRWLSDIECLVVFAPGRDSVAKIWKVLHQIEDDVNQNPSSRDRGLKVELRAIASDRIRNLRPTIFTFEFCEHGKLLWGSLSELAMPTSYLDNVAISKRDAFRLLNNRIIEQIGIRSGCTGLEVDSIGAKYSLVKFWIDLGTSLSIFLGCFKPGYRERQKPFEDLLQQRSDLLGSEISAKIVSHHRDAMAIKLGTKKLETGGLLAEFREAAEIAQVAWYWESGQLLGCSDDSYDWHLIFRRLSSLETVAQRVRDWIRLFRKPMPLSWMGPRALIAAIRAGSLANLIYGSGCVINFFWDDIGNDTRSGREIAAALCPILKVNTQIASERRTMLTKSALRAWETHLRFAAA